MGRKSQILHEVRGFPSLYEHIEHVVIFQPEMWAVLPFV